MAVQRHLRPRLAQELSFIAITTISIYAICHQGLSGSTFIDVATTIGIQIIVIWVAEILSWRTHPKPDVISREHSIVPPSRFSLITHLPFLLKDPLECLGKIRDRFGQGLVSCRVVGYTHHFLFDPHLIKEFFRLNSGAIDNKPVTWLILHRVFGAPNRYEKKFVSALPKVHTCLTQALLRTLSVQKVAQHIIANLEDDIPNLAMTTRELEPTCAPQYFNLNGTGPPSHESSGDSSVEVSLAPLIRSILGHASLPALMGQGFMQFCPEVLRDIWELDDGFSWLLTGLPNWLPICSLRRARRARSRLHGGLTRYHHALDDMEDCVDTGSDRNDVSSLIWSLHNVWKEAGIPCEARGHGTMPLIWASQINAGNLVFWNLLQILSSPSLVRRVHKEIAPYVHFGLEPDGLKIDHRGLTEHCPLLKSCYLESLRLHHEPWSFRRIRKTLLLSDNPSGPSEGVKAHLLSAGDYINIPHYLHQTDGSRFAEPDRFNPDRYLLSCTDGGRQKVTAASIIPFGGGSSKCKGHVLAEIECLGLVAGILAVWDIAPVSDGTWVIPPKKSTAGVSLPVGDLRVRLRKRGLGNQGARFGESGGSE